MAEQPKHKYTQPSYARQYAEAYKSRWLQAETGQFMLMNIHDDNHTTSRDLQHEEQWMRNKYKTEEDDPKEVEIVWDDVFGAELDFQKVRQERGRGNRVRAQDVIVSKGAL